MPITETFHLESRLTAFLNALVYERIRPFSRLHPEHPIIKEIALRNDFYAKILICVLTRQEPRLASFEFLHPVTDADVLYQDGLYLYEKWRSMGIDQAAFNYCQLMNRVLARVNFTDEDIADARFPDLCKNEVEIRWFLRGLKTKKSDHKPTNHQNKKNFKNLALNA